MKKLLLAAVIFIAAYSSAVAQKTEFGFTAGATIANYHSKVDGESDDAKSTIGITVGFLADIPLSANFSFQPALNFVQKGAKEEQSFGGVTEKYKLLVNCLEVPFNFIYTTGTNSGKFFIGGGPSVSFSVSGKAKYDDGTNSISANLHFGNTEDDDLRGLDIAANILAGFHFRGGVFVAVNYNHGFSNLLPGGSSDEKLTSHYFGIRLGYMLKLQK